MSCLGCDVVSVAAAPTRGSASVLARLLRWRQSVRAGVASTFPVLRRSLRRRSVRYSVISGSVTVLVAATIGVGLGVANAQENVEHVTNGTFDSGTGPWYGYANSPAGA